MDQDSQDDLTGEQDAKAQEPRSPEQADQDSREDLTGEQDAKAQEPRSPGQADPVPGEAEDRAPAPAGPPAVGVRFRHSSRIYGFSPGDMDLRKGDQVVVESELGLNIGRVVTTELPHGNGGRKLKPILRKATDEDLRKARDNEALEAEARAHCSERIMARGLQMRLVATSATLDRRRIVFYFTADTRIDFRELVKDLASKFRTRIELRQIGVRDAASISGGMGVCGREFCCRSFLRSFAPISIKMAKKQDLVLNTAKLSGACGRLLCCLNYEYEGYPEFKRAVAEAKQAEQQRKAEEARLAEETRRHEDEERKRLEEERRKARAEQDARERSSGGRAKRSRRRRAKKKASKNESVPGVGTAAQATRETPGGRPADASRQPEEKNQQKGERRPGRRRRRRRGGKGKES